MIQLSLLDDRVEQFGEVPCQLGCVLFWLEHVLTRLFNEGIEDVLGLIELEKFGIA